MSIELPKFSNWRECFDWCRSMGLTKIEAEENAYLLQETQMAVSCPLLLCRTTKKCSAGSTNGKMQKCLYLLGQVRNRIENKDALQ